MAKEPKGSDLRHALEQFRTRVIQSKLDLHKLFADIKRVGHRIVGISAPSRASTLINYVGIDDGIVDYLCEVKGSLKIGKYLPGTLIPVVDESRLFDDQPEYAMVFSWHIADELIPKLRDLGYKGRLHRSAPGTSACLAGCRFTHLLLAGSARIVPKTFGRIAPFLCLVCWS